MVIVERWFFRRPLNKLVPLFANLHSWILIWALRSPPSPLSLLAKTLDSDLDLSLMLWQVFPCSDITVWHINIKSFGCDCSENLSQVLVLL